MIQKASHRAGSEFGVALEDMSPLEARCAPRGDSPANQLGVEVPIDGPSDALVSHEARPHVRHCADEDDELPELWLSVQFEVGESQGEPASCSCGGGDHLHTLKSGQALDRKLDLGLAQRGDPC